MGYDYMRKKLYALLIMLLVLFSVGCNNEQNERKIQKTQDESNHAEGNISENIEIDQYYLKDRYPDKKILTWVFGEQYKDDNEAEYISNLQIVKLNDYLVSKGKEYVIRFQRSEGGKKFVNEIQEQINNDTPPDIISTAEYIDDDKNRSENVKSELIENELLLELNPYLNNELKEYKSSVPDVVMHTSMVNNKLYGFNNRYEETYQHNWFVNEEIADKYGIDINHMEGLNLSELEPYLEKVYQGEKKNGAKDFKVIDILDIPIQEMFTQGYYKKKSKKEEIFTYAFGMGVENENICNYYACPEVKEFYRTYAKYYNKGYLNYINPSSEDENSIDTGACFIYCVGSSTCSLEPPFLADDDFNTYPQVKKWRRVKSMDASIRDWELDDQSVIGVCNRTDNLKESLEILSLIYTDPEMSNILQYPEYIVGTVGNDFQPYRAGAGAVAIWNIDIARKIFSNPYNAENLNGERTNNEKKKLMDNVKYNKKFSTRIYDYTPMKDKIDKIRKIEEKYTGDYYNGLFLEGNFEEQWNKFLKELDSAGINEVLEYLNKQ